MTIAQAIESGVTRIKKPYWNERAFLKLPVSGMWCTLYDIGTESSLLISLADDLKDDWVNAEIPHQKERVR